MRTSARPSSKPAAKLSKSAVQAAELAVDVAEPAVKAAEPAIKAAKSPAKAVKADGKRHQVVLDDDRWAWLDALPGGANNGLQALIDLARNQGFGSAGDATPVSPPPAAAAPMTLSVLADLDPARYQTSESFHVAGAKVYAGTLGAAVNKRHDHMARVVYNPAHFNSEVGGVYRGQGKSFSTWIFSEETAQPENLLKSGLELVMDASLEPNASVGFHKHKRIEEIYYLLAGSLTVATVTADGSVVTETLQAGDAHLVRSGEGHSCIAGDQGARYLTVSARI